MSPSASAAHFHLRATGDRIPAVCLQDSHCLVCQPAGRCGCGCKITGSTLRHHGSAARNEALSALRAKTCRRIPSMLEATCASATASFVRWQSLSAALPLNTYGRMGHFTGRTEIVSTWYGQPDPTWPTVCTEILKGVLLAAWRHE